MKALSADGGPRYLQIADLVGNAVSQGKLKPGDRLPPQRQLADTLGVDLTTVTRAYDEARQRGLLEAHGHRGTYVSRPQSELTEWVDLSMNIPPPPAHVDMEALLKQGLTQVVTRSDVNLLMSYHLGGGSHTDRLAAAQWLSPMVRSVDTTRVVVCPGAQAALAAVILTMTQPGDTILTEPLVYPGLRTAAQQLGRRVECVPTDDAGMRPDALEQACQEHKARLIYLNPTLLNPTMRTMPEDRRRDIITVAARADAKIIEDDPYWLFASSVAPPLAALAPEHVYYISTLSKCLTPGLRTAFVVLPERAIEDRFLSAMRSFALMAMPLATALVTLWIQDGSAKALLAGVQDEVRARQQLATHIFSGSERSQPNDGIHIWQPLPSHWRARDLVRAARAESLALTASDAFYVGPNEPPNAIRISLGGGRDRNQLSTALKNLSALLVTPPTVRTEVVI